MISNTSPSAPSRRSSRLVVVHGVSLLPRIEYGGKQRQPCPIHPLSIINKSILALLLPNLSLYHGNYYNYSLYCSNFHTLISLHSPSLSPPYIHALQYTHRLVHVVPTYKYLIVVRNTTWMQGLLSIPIPFSFSSSFYLSFL